MLQRLLLLPLLSPLLVTLLVAALNPRPSVVLRLLTWQTPAWPIGLWMAVAASGGAALSGGVAALALRQGTRAPGRRTVQRKEVWDPQAWSPPWSDRSEPEGPHAGPTNRRGQPPPAPPSPAASAAAAGPTRAPGDPSPTVSVPYRVLHRPTPVEDAPSRPAPPASAAPWSSPGPAWASSEGDWGEVESEEW